MNTCTCTSRDSQHAADPCHPLGTESQPTGPTWRDMNRWGPPCCVLLLGWCPAQSEPHTAAGITQAPIVLPGSGGQWRTISSLSPQHPLAAWSPGAREPSRRFQSLGETPQRSHSAGGALGEPQSKAGDVTPALGTPRELGAPSTREIQGLHCPARGGHRPTHARSGREVAFLVKSGHSHSASVRLQGVKA